MGRVGQAAGDTRSASICVGCGLCCDGTLLSHLAVADESDLGWPLRVLGVELIAEADPPVFALPCPAVVHGTCAVYDKHRPHACSQFACDLLRDVNDGRITPDAARAVIGETIRQRDRVRSGAADGSLLTALIRNNFRGEP